MQTFRLNLIPDEKFPRFKRLAFQKVEVPLDDVFLHGVHPWDSGSPVHSLNGKFVQAVNSERHFLSELKEFGYCNEFNYCSDHDYNRDVSVFERLMVNISNSIYFVDDLKYLELLAIAKKVLADNWTHKTVSTLVGRVYREFNDIRDFLKGKDKNIKLSGYSDIDRYDLSQILTLEDFEGDDKVLIDEALEITNFRSTQFLAEVTDDNSNLKLTPSISHFQMRFQGAYHSPYEQVLLYNAERKGERIRLHPVMPAYPVTRDQAKKLAQRWRLDNGQYCFTIDIGTAERMLAEGNFKMLFPRLNYIQEEKEESSTAGLTNHSTEKFEIGRFIRSTAPGNIVKDILRKHNVSMTGRKDDLMEKLAQLSVRVYREREKELDDYFEQHHFLKIPGNGQAEHRDFPVINDCDMKNMVLSMYIMKHLRGNTILEASHCNDTFDLLSLANALIKGEICPPPAFVRAPGKEI
jgi:hypothetical protein